MAAYEPVLEIEQHVNVPLDLVDQIAEVV